MGSSYPWVPKVHEFTHDFGSPAAGGGELSTDRKARRPNQDTRQSPLDIPFPPNHRRPSRQPSPSHPILILCCMHDSFSSLIEDSRQLRFTLLDGPPLRLSGGLANKPPPFPGGRPMVQIGIQREILADRLARGSKGGTYVDLSIVPAIHADQPSPQRLDDCTYPPM
jgi:hypothetical protein